MIPYSAERPLGEEKEMARKVLCETCGYLDTQMESLKTVENQKLWVLAFKAALEHRDKRHPMESEKDELGGER